MKKLFSELADARKRHEERHRPTGYQFAVADSIQFLNGADWDAVTDNSAFFLRRPYLSLLERCRPEGLRSKYVVIYDRGHPKATMHAQILHISGDRVLGQSKGNSKNLLQRALSPAARKVGSAVRERALICGNLLSWGCHGAAFAHGVNASELWPAVAEALYRIRRAERLAGQTNLLFIKELSSMEQESAQVLRRLSYRPIETDPDMVLELEPGWRGYPDYLNSLDRKYRKSAQQIFEQIESAGCVLERIRNLESCKQRLHELYLTVHENAAVRPVTISAEYLPGLAEMAGEDFSCLVVRKQDQILGFVTLLKDRDQAIGYYIGYDRSASADLPLYLRLLHGVVEQGIQWGCRRISLGRTALEPKARLGAKPQPLFIWARHRHPTVNFFVRKLAHAIPHQEAPERNPFKEAAPSQ